MPVSPAPMAKANVRTPNTQYTAPTIGHSDNDFSSIVAAIEQPAMLIAAPFSFLTAPNYRWRGAMKIRVEKSGCVGNACCTAMSKTLLPWPPKAKR